MQRSECLLIVISIMLVLLAVDTSLGPELSPWAAYIVPVALASRYCGLSTGAAYAAITAGLLVVAARQSGHPYSADGYFLVAVAWQTAALLVIAWLTARLSALEHALRATLVRQGAHEAGR